MISELLNILTKDNYFLYYAIGMPCTVLYMYFSGYSLLSSLVYINTAFYSAGLVRGKFYSYPLTKMAILDVIIYSIFIFTAINDCIKIFHLAEEEDKENRNADETEQTQDNKNL